MLASYVSDSEAKVEKIHVPLVGLGTYNAFKDPNAVAAVVKEAIVLGYRHFDLAKMVNTSSKYILFCVSPPLLLFISTRMKQNAVPQSTKPSWKD